MVQTVRHSQWLSQLAPIQLLTYARYRVIFKWKFHCQFSKLVKCSLSNSIQMTNVLFPFRRYVRDIVSRPRFPRRAPSNSSVPATIATPANQLQRSPSNEPNEPNDRYSGRRNKRQSAGRESLCETTYQYITPQAALNSQGRYIPGIRNRMKHSLILMKRTKTLLLFFFLLVCAIRFRQLDVHCKSSRPESAIGANGNMRVSCLKCMIRTLVDV